jgi:hypothetical protein
MFRRAAQMKKVSIEPFYILKLIALFLTIEIIFLVVWTIVDPPTIYYMKTDEDMWNPPYEVQCRTSNGIFWAIFLAYKGVWLVFGAVLCFLMRNISKEYNKSKGIAYSIYNNVVIILVAAPMAAVLEDVEYALVVVKVVAIVCSFTFTLFILNFTVWYKIFYEKFDIVAGLLKQRGETTSTVTTIVSSSSSRSTDSPTCDSGQSRDAVYSKESSYA